MDDTPIERRKVFCVLPYFHVYGEVCCILYCTFSCATQIILPRFDVDEVIDTMKQFSEYHVLALRAHHAAGDFEQPQDRGTGSFK